MSAAAPTVAQIREAQAALAAHDGPCAAVAAALAEILAGGDPVVALGLRSARGRNPVTVDRLARRDEQLRAWRALLHPEDCAAQAAAHMLAEAQRYERRLAQADQMLAQMPDGYRGTPRQYLFTIARIPATMPGQRQLQTILSVKI